MKSNAAKINNVADLIVETLQKAGVARIFGLVGDSLNGITKAIRGAERDRPVHMLGAHWQPSL